MHSVLKFLSKYYSVFFFLLLEVAAIFFIYQNSYYQSSAITNFFNNIASNIYTKQGNIVHYFSLEAENERLASENALLRSQMETSFVKIINTETQHSDTTYHQQYSYIEATVISKTVGKRNNLFMLNKGSLQGVERDMCVFCPNGLVGVVVKTTEKFSLVMPVLHQDSKSNVRNSRTKVTGTLVWEGGNYKKGKLIDFPSSIPLVKGDTIVTSGFSADIPEGLTVGYVDEFRLDKSSGFYIVDINFSADYNNLEHVYIIKNFFKQEQKKLLEGVKDE